MGASVLTSFTANPRVAILGLHLEANSFARVTTRADFEAECWEEGEAISEKARRTSNLPLEVPGFYDRMDATGAWTAVPVMMAAAQPGGPIEQALFDDFMVRVEHGLSAALPVDAVYVCSHGGSKATGDDDNDGTLVVRVRELVGPGVPIVVTHDLHCSVSERMIAAADSLIAYRTNPHVDHRERAAEAADMIRLMLSGAKTTRAFVRLPLAPPGVTMLAEQGRPFGDLLRRGEALCKPPILNISITGGFVLTDVPKSGFTINVTALDDQAAADRVAMELAESAWADRERYRCELTSISDAVALAHEAAAGRRKPIALADLADNPGGGAPGNTVWLMQALHEARVPGVIVGLHCDPDLAGDAQAAGAGAMIDATFNRVEGQFANRFEARARILSLSDGFDVGRRGRDAGRQIVLGRSALLELEESGLKVVVTSLREQPADPRTFEMFGVDIGAATCAVLKSRGHFRAGFDEYFLDDQIFEVDAPGLTSNVLTNFAFTGLRRPIYPLDPETRWTPTGTFIG